MTQIANFMRGVNFPLTPSLSLGERENGFQFFGKARAVTGLNGFVKSERGQLLFPLPWGEGQGEGKIGEAFNSRIQTAKYCFQA